MRITTQAEPVAHRPWISLHARAFLFPLGIFSLRNTTKPQSTRSHHFATIWNSASVTATRHSTRSSDHQQPPVYNQRALSRSGPRTRTDARRSLCATEYLIWQPTEHDIYRRQSDYGVLIGEGFNGKNVCNADGHAVRFVCCASRLQCQQSHAERYRLSDISRSCYPIAVIFCCLYFVEKKCAWINWTRIHDDVVLCTSRAVYSAKARIDIELLRAQPTWQACLALENACRQHSNSSTDKLSW